MKNLAGVVGLKSRRGKFLEAAVQNPGHHFEKPAGAGRAFVVHLKVDDAPGLAQRNDLAVLTADVDHGANGRVEVMYAAGVPRDFRDVLVHALDVGAPVPGRDEVLDFGVGREFCRFQCEGHGVVGRGLRAGAASEPR